MIPEALASMPSSETMANPSIRLGPFTGFLAVRHESAPILDDQTRHTETVLCLSTARACSRHPEKTGKHRTNPLVARLAVKPIAPVLKDFDFRHFYRRPNDFQIEILGEHRRNRHW